MGYSGFPLWIAIARTRRKTHGWLRIHGRSVVVRSLDWIPVFPKLIEWKSPQVIVLSGRGTKYELTFPTTESLTRAVTRSEERRVGKECRYRRSTDSKK